MKVLLFCPAMSINSGSGIRARLIAEGLARRGASVGVVTAGLPESLAEVGVRGFSLTDGAGWREALEKAAALHHPDIIYGITEAAMDLIAAVGKSIKCPVAYDLHGLGFVEILELGSGHGPRLERLRNSLRWLLRVPSAALVTVANPKLYPILRPFNRRTVSVLGMTDITQFNPTGPRVQLGRDSERLQVLYAGNYFKWQGVDLLVNAIKRLGSEAEKYEFTFLGSVGKEKVEIDRWRGELPEKHVHFLDGVDYSKVAAYYRGADILVIPRPFMLSTYLAFPQKLVDYMAAGKAIVATDIAPHRWALQEPPCGLLCQASARGVAEGLLRLQNADLRRSLGENARSRAEEHFCHLGQAGRILSCFHEIAGAGK